MKKHLIIPFLPLLVLITACEKDYDQLAANHFSNTLGNHPEHTLQFEEGVSTSSENYQLFSQLSASPDDRSVIVPFLLVNQSDSSILVNSSNFTLHTPDGNFGQPQNMNDELSIEPGGLLQATLLFQPINNRRLFIKTGNRGDLNQEYELKTDLAGEQLSTTHQIPSSVWNNYIAHMGVEKNIKIFIAKLDADRQKEYQVMDGKSDFVHVDENEISIAGTNLQFNAFQVQDTFNLHIKIVNHGNDMVYVAPEYLSDILGADAPLLKGDLETYKLEKSKRFINKYQFYSPKSLDKFIIPKEFIVVPKDDSNKTLLIDNIGFEVAEL